MTYTSIIEKLLFLFNIVSTSWIYIVYTIIAILLISLLGLKRITKKTCFILIALATKLLLGYTVYIHYEPISNMINSIVDNIFLNIYFPSAYAYLFILTLINIVTIASFLKPRGEKVYKTINGVCFIITNFVLTLILEIIAKDKIDIFVKESLFANPNLITLLEFSINIFIGWIISLVAIYLINNITERIIITRENKKLVSEPAITITQELQVNMPSLQENHQTTNVPTIENPVQAIMPETYQYKFIPNFTIETATSQEQPQNKFISTTNVNESVNNKDYSYNYDNNSFDLSAFIPKKQNVKPINISDTNITTNSNTNQIFEQIIKNELPIVKEAPAPVSIVEEVKNTYTLNDYRIFNKMLKDIREHNQSNSVTIDKNLEYRLITKYSTEKYDMFKTMLKIYSN